VRIPAGIKDGSRVRVPGEGVPGSGGGPTGDLYLRVRLAPHPRFERKGQDLHVRSACRSPRRRSAARPTCRRSPAATCASRCPRPRRNGQVFRLRGQGMPGVGKPDQRGDLYVMVEVEDAESG